MMNFRNFLCFPIFICCLLLACSGSNQISTNHAPDAIFEIDPVTGNTETNFEFDASRSTDHETRNSDLEYRWDWEGDDNPDTEWSRENPMYHRYLEDGEFSPTLFVRDSWLEEDSHSLTLSINPVNGPTAVATVEPDSAAVNDVFVFDASASTDIETPQAFLEVRWDWENNGSYDTDWSTEKLASHQFTVVGFYEVLLQVRDEEGLTGIDIVNVGVYDDTNLPVIALSITPESGNTSTLFEFDASASHDPNYSIDDLEVRWDWENDGIFDLDWNSQKIESHQYTTHGDYNARIEIRNPLNYRRVFLHQIHVTAGSGIGEPPAVVFDASPLLATTDMLITIDASASHDAETATEDLLIRWDWGNDGSFDTAWTTDKTASWQYATTGTKTIVVEVKDADGNIDIASQNVQITDIGFVLQFINRVFTTIHLQIDGFEDRTIPQGNAIFYYYPENPANVYVDGRTAAYTDGDNMIGQEIVWQGNISIEAGNSLQVELNANEDIFFLKMRNIGSYQLADLYVNYGLAEESHDLIIVPNDGFLYYLGYFAALENTVVRMREMTEGGEWIIWDSLNLPMVINQSVTLEYDTSRSTAESGDKFESWSPNIRAPKNLNSGGSPTNTNLLSGSFLIL
jgi:PKD repeat protein